MCKLVSRRSSSWSLSSNTVVENGFSSSTVVSNSTTNGITANSSNSCSSSSSSRKKYNSSNGVYKIKLYRSPLMVSIALLIGIFVVIGTWMVIDFHSSTNSYASNGNENNFQWFPIDRELPENNTEFQLTSKNAPICRTLNSPDEITLTLVTQVSHNRLWMMAQHCGRYPHRISVAVFTKSTREEIEQLLANMGCNVNRNGNGIGEVDVSVLDTCVYGASNEYPVNHLRTLALRNVRTTHMLYVDVDFWPSESLYETIMEKGGEKNATSSSQSTISSSFSEARIALFNDPKQALVIPAFELKKQQGKFKFKDMERTLLGLAKGLKKKRIEVFHRRDAFGGHGSTNYMAWFRQSIGSLHDIPCLYSNRYEPYVVVRYCRDLPPFQLAFNGYGHNKVTWIMQLASSGYVLSQIGGAYLLHYPHWPSSSRFRFNKSRVDIMLYDFQQWMKESIPSDRSRLKLCDYAEDGINDLWIDPKLKIQPVQNITKNRTKTPTKEEKRAEFMGEKFSIIDIYD